MPITSSRSARLVLAASFIIAGTLGSPSAAVAQNGTDPDAILRDERYVRPPAEIERLVLAPRHQNVTLSNQSPTRRNFARIVGDGLAPVTLFGKPWYNLAGVQIDYKANRARSLTTRGGAGIEIFDAITGRTTRVDVPRGARVSDARWSPDGTQIAFFANFDDASYLYVADVSNGRSRRVSDAPVLATLVTEPRWASATEVMAVLVPQNRGAEPKAPAIATGPKVRLTNPGKENATRTYVDLLEWPHEKDLLEYYTTGQLAAIDVRTRAVRTIGDPAMIDAVSAAPSGGWLRVTSVREPFSYAVPVSSFGAVEEIWDASGRRVAELTRRDLRETTQRNDDDDDSVADTTLRNIEWMPNGEGLYFLQRKAEPADTGGRPEAEAGSGAQRSRSRDRLIQWTPPFSAATRKVLLESNNRISEAAFSSDAKTVFIAENASGTAHVYAVELADPSKRYTITRVRGLQASVGLGSRGFGGGNRARAADSVTFYQNPGTLVTDGGAKVPAVLTSRDGRFAYLEGVQYYRAFQDSAPQPFLDRVEIKTGEKSRMFTSARDQFERVSAALDADFSVAVVERESPTDVPDFYRRDMSTGSLTKLTNNRDYTPDITTAQRQMFKVGRPDGYEFWVNVTLPRDWKPGSERLPTFIWFYPREYTDQSGYDRTKRTFNRNQFPNLGARSMVYLITQGYAVVEPDAPIVGEEGRMNDNYVHDLRNNLAAVIDELERRGIADRKRIGIGGHSYGAFSTVNAMVHTPFFKAGIAGDGNYNRTLTPNSFQSERRNLWEARETYFSMSPLFYADRLTGALLMYHNLEDQNVGTWPINSERLFHALQGFGKPAALYMHPYEDHGPAARETLLDLWGRWVAWLDKHLKNEKTDAKVAAELR